MARAFDRPTAGNLSTPAQIVRFFDKFLTALEANLGALSAADAALAAALAAAHTADWSGVNDDDGHRPDNDATLGAAWATNLTGRPTELTDGRVSAGLTSAGDLNRDITTTRANSSNLLRKTSGGLFTGDLTATFGANLATNVTNAKTSNLTDDANLGSTGVLIDPFPSVTIYADGTGTVKSAQLPKSVSLTASNGTADVTTSGTWSRTVTTGVTCTIGAATGIVSITALSASAVEVPISFTYSGVTRTGTLKIIRQDDAPTNTGGAGATGGTTGTTTTLGDTTGTAYDTTNAVSNTLTVIAGSGGRVDLSAPITYDRSTAISGSTGALGKWQWRVPAGVWADAPGGETTYTIAASSSSGSGEISAADAVTGLTNGSTYEFRFLWRRSNVSGTASNIYRVTGTLTAVGS